MSDHEGGDHGEEPKAPLSRAEIQRLVADSVTAALRARDEDLTQAGENPPLPIALPAGSSRPPGVGE